MTEPQRSFDEFAQRGDAIYEREVRPQARAADTGKFVAIDVDTGLYEIDRTELAATDRLLARRPGARVWLRRIGSRYAHRFGPRSRPAQA